MFVKFTCKAKGFLSERRTGIQNVGLSLSGWYDRNSGMIGDNSIIFGNEWSIGFPSGYSSHYDMMRKLIAMSSSPMCWETKKQKSNKTSISRSTQCVDIHYAFVYGKQVFLS